MKEDSEFYFSGKTFNDQEEFFKWVEEWGLKELDQESAERQLDVLKKDIIMNIFLRGKKFTNNEFRQYVNRIFEIAIIEMDKK